MDTEWNFQLFGIPIRISIDGIQNPWDWTILVIYVLVQVGVPATLLGMIYFDYKQQQRRKQSALPPTTIASKGEQAWNPLTEGPVSSVSVSSSSRSSPPVVEEITKEQRPLSINEPTSVGNKLVPLWRSKLQRIISRSKIVAMLRLLRKHVQPTKPQ